MIKFADEVTIEVGSGKGGNGCIAFHREKFITKGGPSGGDGGRGGDVVFEVKRNLRTLAHLRYRQTFYARAGGDGMGKKMHGRDGDDVIILIPPGTIIKDAETGEVIKDFDMDTAGTWRFLKGGNGGWGNVHYKNSVNQAPKFAQPGQEAKIAKLKIELNVLADIGFVGFPNAGKSSLLDAFTNARPKIAPYPFTTKIPNLGMLNVHERDIVLADIPGIIEGASEGIGLGIRFLKHISRTSALAFLVDLSDENALTAFPVLLKELEAFSPELAEKKRILIGTKLDLEEAQERFEEFKKTFADETIYGISVFTKEGLEEIKEAFFKFVIDAEEKELAEAAALGIEPIAEPTVNYSETAWNDPDSDSTEL